MAQEGLLEGVSSRTVETGRLRTHLLESGPEDGSPVLFVHGNASDGRFFEETLAAMPAHRGLAPDLRGFGGSEARPVDATRGLAGRAVHLVGWSAGGPVAMLYAATHPETVASLALVNPMSPYGFGGTRDDSGAPCWPDFAGSGGGTANPEFVGRLAANDRTADDPNSPRNVMNNFYFAPPFRTTPEREEILLSSVLSTRTGDGNYPGDMTTSNNWPGVAPATRGMNNAISPKYCDVSGFARAFDRTGPKPPVLWVRGSADTIVSDNSFLDFGTLGRMGYVPGWPGDGDFPSQPMVSQTRAVLEGYAAAGGSYREEVLDGCGHTPHVEKPMEFRRIFFNFLEEAS